MQPWTIIRKGKQPIASSPAAAGNVDVRSVEDAAARGDQRAQLALNMYVHRLKRYLGAFFVHLRGHVDAIVFSAGGPLYRFGG